MQVSISTRHGHLNERTRARITAKVEKLSRYFERLTAIEVTIDLDHQQAPTADLRVSAEHKHDFVATNQAGELMTAVDNALHKLEHQLRKYKDKVQSRHRGATARSSAAAASPEAPSE